MGEQLIELLNSVMEGCLRAYGTTWFEDAAKEACASIRPVIVESGHTGHEVLVTVRKTIFARGRVIASVRVKPWDGEQPWEQYIEAAVVAVYSKIRQDISKLGGGIA